jgi:ribosomal protein S27E
VRRGARGGDYSFSKSATYLVSCSICASVICRCFGISSGVGLKN